VSYLIELVSQAIAERPLTLSNEQTIKYARRTNGVIQQTSKQGKLTGLKNDQ